jgi:hypothetical protein
MRRYLPAALLGPWVVAMAVLATTAAAALPPSSPEGLSDDPAADAPIRTVWARLARALKAQDVEAVVSCFIPSEQESYRTMFEKTPKMLLTLVPGMAVIEQVYVQGDVAKYRLRRSQVVQAQSRAITHYIYFFKMPDGAWLIDSF